MKTFARIVIFLAVFSLFTTVNPIITYAAEPFAPFSVEGNPDEKYIWEEFFPLFRYVRPAALKVFENMDRSRKYAPLEICSTGRGGQLADRRDQECDNLKDDCTGGQVDLCDKNSGAFDHTVVSQNGSCSATENDPPGTTGECSYTKKPVIKRDIKGTDFSADASTPDTTEPANPDAAISSLNYPKLQTEHNLQQFVGGDNALGWGMQYLKNNECEVVTRKLLTVYRAGQTKATLRETGEWPLGWVDWGYVTANGKTLLQIGQELPGPLSSTAMSLADKLDRYYRNGLHPEDYNLSSEKETVCTYLGNEAKKPEASRAEWFKDLLQAPIYPPSFRQGYVRASICVWNDCCPGLNCPFVDHAADPMGKSLTLYYDISISAAFNASLDEIHAAFSSDYGEEYIRNIALTNPLIRFAMSADKEATPTKIVQRFEAEFGNNNCLPYLPKINKFSITWFGTVMDRVQPNTFIGPGKTCPNYQLMPDMSKEKAAAFPQTLLATIINFFWAKRVDDVDLVREHLITIPEAMGQSITELSQDNYNIQDKLSDLFEVKDFNSNLSNVVDDSAELLFAGKTSDPQNARRIPGFYTCGDSYFAAQTETSIEDYVFGNRPGCTDDIESACNGEAFAKLLEKSNGVATKPSAKATEYFKSNIQSRLTPELMKTYAKAEKETGVPCEILAGIHFVEADNNPEGSLVSGRRIGTEEPDAGGKVFRTLQDTANYAGDHLLSKVGGNLKDVPTAITALSRYNGGGNSNCQLGYPYPIPYEGCPREFEGEDDPYPTNFLDDKHSTMYLLYCADHTACEPQVFERPGSYTVALAVYENITKNGNSNFKDADPVPTPKPDPNNKPLPVFAPKNCDPTSLDTALGCLPYDERLTGVLLGFVAGISGAISLVVMLIGVFQIMTAGADPEKLKKGKELFTGAIVGLLFVIFSVTLLRIIAGDIIKLPGF